jgi:hypothetical protein
MTIEKNLVGAAGEHLVLSRLLRRGLLAAQSPRGAKKADIIVHPIDGGSTWLIQVKTKLKSSKTEWIMKPEHATTVDSDLIYCFVDLHSSPEKIYVVPSKVVAKVLTDADKVWMDKPRRDGKEKAEHKLRMLKNEFMLDVKSAPDGWMEKYLEKWELLG